MILEFSNVTMTYGKKKKDEVLRGICLEVNPGDWISIVGPSGCGKTTLLNLAGCLLRPTSGEVLVENTRISCLNDQELAKIRNTQIGFVFQSSYLISTLTILENVLVPIFLTRRRNLKEIRLRAEILLHELGLENQIHNLPHQLSPGQRRRVALARALINKPSILLADEPTNNLDPSRANQIVMELCKLHQAGITLLTVTHNPELSRLASRQFRITGGILETI